MPEVITGLPNSYFSWIGLLFLLAAHIHWFGISGYAVTSHVSLPGPKPWMPWMLLDALGCLQIWRSAQSVLGDMEKFTKCTWEEMLLLLLQIRKH